MEQRAYFSLQLSDPTPSLRKGRAETAVKAGEYCLLGCSACSLTAFRTNNPRVAPPNVRWALPRQGSIKKIPYRFAHRSVWWGHILNWSFLPNDSSVCPNDIKQAYTSDPDAATYYNDGNLSLIGHKNPRFIRDEVGNHTVLKNLCFYTEHSKMSLAEGPLR